VRSASEVSAFAEFHHRFCHRPVEGSYHFWFNTSVAFIASLMYSDREAADTVAMLVVSAKNRSALLDTWADRWIMMEGQICA